MPSSLTSLLHSHLQTLRLTLELLNYTSEHYACLLAAMNSPTAHATMGDFGIDTPAKFDSLLRSTRLRCSTLVRYEGAEQPVEVDTDLYYVMRLRKYSEGSHGENEGLGECIGGVSLSQRGDNIPPDIGWAVLEEFQGQGFASEAAAELLRLVRGQMGIEEVMAWPGPGNAASVAVAQKIGLVEGGRVRDGKGKEQVVYAVEGMRVNEEMVLSLAD